MALRSEWLSGRSPAPACRSGRWRLGGARPAGSRPVRDAAHRAMPEAIARCPRQPPESRALAEPGREDPAGATRLELGRRAPRIPAPGRRIRRPRWLRARAAPAQLGVAVRLRTRTAGAKAPALDSARLPEPGCPPGMPRDARRRHPPHVRGDCGVGAGTAAVAAKRARRALAPRFRPWPRSRASASRRCHTGGWRGVRR